jgi:GDP-mannose transporter
VYSLVGSLNKIPLAVISILLFRLPMDAYSLSSILVGLAAGVLFTVTR